MSNNSKRYVDGVFGCTTIYIVVLAVGALGGIIFGLVDWAFGSGGGVSEDYFKYSLLVTCFVVMMFVVMRLVKAIALWSISRSEKTDSED